MLKFPMLNYEKTIKFSESYILTLQVYTGDPNVEKERGRRVKVYGTYCVRKLRR